MSEIDDLLDRLVAEYSDARAAGRAPARDAVLARVGPGHRPALERCLRMIDAGAASAPSAVLAPGLVLDRFRIVRELGRGGMALVFLAEEPELRRHVALKVIRPGLAMERRHVDRFRREAAAMARLEHPHVVRVFGVGEARGFHYLAMEHVPGPTLADVLARLPRDGPSGPAELAEASGIASLASAPSRERAVALLLAPVASALAAAHAAGLVHRDVKPSNVLLHPSGRAMLADFGLAKGDDDPALSLTGDALGTPWYMSPEQAGAMGPKIDARTDVYSLGVALFEALTSRRPFEGATALAVLEAIRTEAPPSVRSLSPTLSRDADAVVRRAMQRSPGDRYATARELADDLAALAEGRPTRALAEQGGPMRSFFGRMRAASAGEPYEYRSPREWLGLPLIHVNVGRGSRHEKMR
ncbi:MAG TPA: serine/threonine-protein kinase, partial [Planctomycetota bacterium]|nr:serine/threonine-protein kinase [Planctomycetota bacterium]